MKLTSGNEGMDGLKEDRDSGIRVIDAMQWGSERLAAGAVDSPRPDADLLLADVLNLSRDRLYLERDCMLSIAEWEDYKRLIEQRADRQPLQYLRRRQEFMGLDFYVDERVLIPRPETELLVETVLGLKAETAVTHPRILDLCTGSGAIAIAIKHFWPEAGITGIDISAEALAVARLNAQRLGVEVEFCQGNFLQGIEGKWDFIVTNPPYIAEADYLELQAEVHREPRIALVAGTDGLNFYRLLASQARDVLNDRGVILMEIGWDQGAEVCTLFNQAGFTTELLQDLAGKDRVVLAG